MDTPSSIRRRRFGAFITHGWARWVALAALFALLALGSLGVAAWYQARVANSPDAISIGKVCYGALLAQQTVTTPPPGYHGGPIVGATQQQMLDRAAQVFAQYYTGQQLAYEVGASQGAIRGEQGVTGNRILGGGVQRFAVTQIAIHGATATVTAQAIIWLDVAQDDGHDPLVVASPHNAISANFALVRSHGRWLISAQTVRFASGSGP